MTPALAAAPAIIDVSAAANSGVVTFDAHVVGDPSAGIQGVWVTYTGFDHTWQSVDLVQDATDSTHWSRTLVVPVGHSASELQFMVQAVNGVGLVALSDDYGRYYAIATAPAGARSTTAVSLDQTPTTGAYGSSVTFSAGLTGATPGRDQPLVFSLGGATRTVLTDVNGRASATFQLTSAPGSSALSVSYLGDGSNNGASVTRAFPITKLGTVVQISGSLKSNIGMDSGIVATLKDANNIPLGQRTLFFVVSGPGGARTTTAITDYLGRASLGAIPLPVGSYTLNVYFDGTIPLFCPRQRVDHAYGRNVCR